jgi:hypothetical protein
MKVEIFGYPEFHIPLTLEHVDMLIRQADRHHMEEVQDMIKKGGILHVWRGHIDGFMKIGAHHIPPCTAKTKDLNLCLKVLESRVLENMRDQELAAEIRSVFTQCVELAAKAMPKWHITYKPEHHSF